MILVDEAVRVKVFTDKIRNVEKVTAPDEVLKVVVPEKVPLGERVSTIE